MSSDNYSKLTPEKVWQTTNTPYYLPLSGGTLNGGLTVSGNETVTGNLQVNGSITGAGGIPPTIALTNQFSVATTSGTSTAVNTSNTALVTYGTTFSVVSGGKYLVFLPFSVAVTAWTFAGSATSGDLVVNINFGTNTYPANYQEAFTIAGSSGNYITCSGVASFAIAPSATNATLAPVLNAICVGGLATAQCLGSITGVGGSQAALVRVA
jgi:hypothetical protein